MGFDEWFLDIDASLSLFVEFIIQMTFQSSLAQLYV